MKSFRSGYTVSYVVNRAARRAGKFQVTLFREGVKFLLIVFRVCTLYSPLKLFFPVTVGQLLLGVGYYSYIYPGTGRFTNRSALLLTSAITIFLIELGSEQITSLLCKRD